MAKSMQGTQQTMHSMIPMVTQMALIIVMMLGIPALRILEIILMWAALILTVISLIDYIAKNKEVLTNGGM